MWNLNETYFPKATFMRICKSKRICHSKSAADQRFCILVEFHNFLHILKLRKKDFVIHTLNFRPMRSGASDGIAWKMFNVSLVLTYKQYNGHAVFNQQHEIGKFTAICIKIQ